MKTHYISPKSDIQLITTTIVCASGISSAPQMNLDTDYHNSPKNSR
ncbi:MAG: hypothetical protein IJT35_07685 [Paludibacteraceae bacterium]|nr:hypothetical protein [Paludibacteraceae bacterium]